MRTNLAILDELESGMSARMQNLYTTSFLPKLKTLVPFVIVVTPLAAERFYVPHSAEYAVKAKTVGKGKKKRREAYLEVVKGDML
jgi:hypothetical protein